MARKSVVVINVVLYLLGLLSVAAGVPKVLQMPQELSFLASIGLSAAAVSALGVVQAIGGIMLFWSGTRLVGALLAGAAFVVSSIAIFGTGDTTFGLLSLLPVIVLAMAIFFGRTGEDRSAA